MTHSPLSWNRLFLRHAILRPDALHNVGNKRIWKHIRMPHCTIHSISDVLDDLEWVGNLYDSPLLNNNLLVRRDMSCVLSNKRMLAHKWMRYTVEPFDVPLTYFHSSSSGTTQPLSPWLRTWTTKSWTAITTSSGSRLPIVIGGLRLVWI